MVDNAICVQLHKCIILMRLQMLIIIIIMKTGDQQAQIVTFATKNSASNGQLSINFVVAVLTTLVW